MTDKDWLLKKDNYVPKNDKDKFINKTIISLIGVLSKIKKNSLAKDNIVYKVNPLAKILGSLLIIIMLSLSKNTTYTFIIGTFIIGILSILDGDDILRILTVSIIIPIFTLIMLIPSMLFMNNFYSSLILVFKIFLTVTLMNILSSTSNWHSVTKSLKSLFVPDIFILVFDITLRYIFLLGEFSLDMLYSLKLKSVGVNKEKRNSLLSVIGNLFLKSKNMGEDVYSAMECRGFTGEYKSITKFNFKYIDYIYCLLCIGIFILYFIYH